MYPASEGEATSAHECDSEPTERYHRLELPSCEDSEQALKSSAKAKAERTASAIEHVKNEMVHLGTYQARVGIIGSSADGLMTSPTH